MNCYRYLGAFGGESVNHKPEDFLMDPMVWHRVMKDMLFFTQEILGSSVAVRVYPYFDIFFGSFIYSLSRSSIAHGLSGTGTARLLSADSSCSSFNLVSSLSVIVH